MSDAIEVWMDGLANRKESTRELYRQNFERFCEWARKTPDELRRLKFEEDQKEKPWERTQVENLVRKFMEYLTNEVGLTNLNNPYYSIRSFFSSNGLPLNLNGGDAPINRSSQGSTVPSAKDVKRVINSCEYLRDRCMVLFLKDSGLRTSDLEAIMWGDLQPMGDGYFAFEIVTKKQSVLARGFIGPETSKILELYKGKRLTGTRKRPAEEDIEEHPVIAKMTKGKNPKTHGSKPLEARVMTARLSHIFKLAGMRKKGVSAHGLRKYWEQHVHAKKESYVKQLNGRALTRSEKAYDWLTREQLFDIYKENYDDLRVLSETVISKDEIERIVEKRVQERMRGFANLRDEVDDLKRIVKELLEKS